MLIKSATIVDGTKRPRFRGDIRIDGEYIAEIGEQIPKKSGEAVLDVGGQIVMPGFVDILNHTDRHLTLFSNPQQYSLVQQGITTMLIGGCGSSLAPLVRGQAIETVQKWTDPGAININWHSTKEFLEEMERHPIALNVATLAGHTTIRRGLVGDDFRPLDEKEMRQMEYLMEGALSEGAFGLSLGLAYSHAKIAPKDEIEQIFAVAGRHNVLCAVHLRNEGEHMLAALEETLEMAKKNKTNIEVSHFKMMGEKFWNEFDAALDRISAFHEMGLRVNFDVYPYSRTASVLYTFLPDWAVEGGRKKLLARIKATDARARLMIEMRADSNVYDDMIIATANIDSMFIGKTMREIAKNQGISVEEAVLNILTASEDRVVVFTNTISEENLEKSVRHPLSFAASDGAGYRLEDSQKGYLIHPRAFGAFPRFFSTYVQQKKVLSWEEMAHKASWGPAQKIGLQKRGKLERGFYADMLIVDPQTFKDLATFDNPYQYPLGVHYVFVNGEITAQEGKHTKKLNGHVLRRAA